MFPQIANCQCLDFYPVVVFNLAAAVRLRIDTPLEHCCPPSGPELGDSAMQRSGQRWLFVKP